MPRFRHAFLTLAAAFALTTLGGCTAFERGADQGDPSVDAVTGCPELSGTFALDGLDANGEPDPLIDPAKRAALDAELFTPRVERATGPGDLAAYGGVVIQNEGTHALKMRFVHAVPRVLESLERIREHERPRYAEWYALMHSPTREAYVAAHGEAARENRLRELGPDTGISVTLERNRDYTCEDGWVLLPRAHRQPVRMTLDDGGHLVFESKEFETYDVPVWCGDGCKGFAIPTGAYLGTARWPRNPAAGEWVADEAAQGFVFSRPADVVEAEQAAFRENNRRHSLRLYATPEEVRAALTPLLPEGVAIVGVEITELPFKGPRVRVHAMPADAGTDSDDQRKRLEWLLAALKEGDPGHIEDSEVVKRAIVGGGRTRHEYEIFLDTHPAVQPRPATGASDAPAVPTVVAAPVVTVVPPAPPSLPPPGSAAVDVVMSRLGVLMADGCRIDAVRYSGDAVTVSGTATTMRCVSDSLRAIHGVLPSGERGVELVQIAAADGGYRFDLRVPPSPLTRE